MLDTYAFAIVAAIVLISAAFIFIEKKLVHAVIALSLVFLGSALLFFLLGQALMGLLQLLVFVGGLTTYLVVAVATEEKSAKLISPRWFLALALLLFAGIGAFLLDYLPSSNVNVSADFLSAASSAMQNSYALFYVMLVLLFAVSISSVLSIKKFTRLLV